MAPSSGWSVEKEMSIELTADVQSKSVNYAAISIESVESNFLRDCEKKKNKLAPLSKPVKLNQS